MPETLRTDWAQASPVETNIHAPAPLWNCCRDCRRPANFAAATNLEIQPCRTYTVPLLNAKGEIVGHDTFTEPVHAAPSDPASSANVFWSVYMRHEDHGAEALGDFPSLEAARSAAESMRAEHPDGGRLPIDVLDAGLGTH